MGEKNGFTYHIHGNKTSTILTNRKEDYFMDDYNNQKPDNGGFLWGLLGCCIPVVGLILFLVWKDEKPKTAKAAGLGALISVILGILSYILIFVLFGLSFAAFL